MVAWCCAAGPVSCLRMRMWGWSWWVALGKQCCRVVRHCWNNSCPSGWAQDANQGTVCQLHLCFPIHLDRLYNNKAFSSKRKGDYILYHYITIVPGFVAGRVHRSVKRMVPFPLWLCILYLAALWKVSSSVSAGLLLFWRMYVVSSATASYHHIVGSNR